MLIKGLTKKEYFKQYYINNKKNPVVELCSCCNIYCSKNDKHYKTEEHYINLSIKYNLNLKLLLSKKTS